MEFYKIKSNTIMFDKKEKKYIFIRFKFYNVYGNEMLAVEEKNKPVYSIGYEENRFYTTHTEAGEDSSMYDKERELLYVWVEKNKKRIYKSL